MFEAFNDLLSARTMQSAICECDRAIAWMREQAVHPVKVNGTLPENDTVAYTVINATYMDEYQCVIYSSDLVVTYARYVVAK